MLDLTRWLVVGHAFGARYDLPVPLLLFILGGAAVVFASFLLVLPRPVPVEGGAIYRDSPGRRFGNEFGAAFGWLVVLLLVVCGFIGSQDVSSNIVPTVFWLVIWIAVPISCALIGDWTRPFNPYAALARAVDSPRLRHAILGGPPLPWPRWLGWWPAAVIFFIVACGELIYNATATKPAATAFGLLVYALITAAAALVFGADRWLERGDMASVLFNTWGRLGYFRFGAPGDRGFGGGLKARFEPEVSRITFVLLLLVSVSFDGLLATPAWKHARDSLPSSIAPETAPYLLLTTLAFLVLLGIAWAFFYGFSAAVRRAGRLEGTTLQVLSGLLPSLVPIAFGYLVAHNAEYLAINGQLLLPLLGNPAGLSNWPTLPYPFNSSYAINIGLLPSSVVWYAQVALIIFVHVAAVILAHDYATRTARTSEDARRSEWPWIVAMVFYTMSSLWLLAQPLVE